MSGTLSFGLGFRDSVIIIVLFGALAAVFPAYLSTWGSKFGLRQMIHARYSFGWVTSYYLNLTMHTKLCLLLKISVFTEFVSLSS